MTEVAPANYAAGGTDNGSAAAKVSSGVAQHVSNTSAPIDVLDSDNDAEVDDVDDDDEDGAVDHDTSGGGVQPSSTGVGGGGGDGGELLSETTVKSGYLYKRGEKRKNWKKRWFVLRSAKLYYYKNEKEYQLLRFIDMTEVHTIAPVALKKAEHCFGISTSKRQYYVRASNAKELQSWVDALRDVREQVRQRSTITRDMAQMDIGSSGEQAPSMAAATPTAARRPSGSRQTSTSPQLAPVDRPVPTAKPTGSTPISIMIPGKGLYTAPAQPRTTSTGIVLSPLSSTSDSDLGAHGGGGAEQFGLSYASSAGQSLGSSPVRGGVLSNLTHAASTVHRTNVNDHSGGGNSPISGDDAHEAARRSRLGRTSSGLREASTSSSVGDGRETVAKSGQPTTTSGFSLQRRSSSQHPQAFSSSEDEEEGDDWDEEEEADRAMPLPSPGGMHLLGGHAHSAQQQQSAQTAQQQRPSQKEDVIATPSKPKVGPEFFKDSSKVIHQGYLMKQSNRRKHWRKRWFVLTSSALSYTRSHMDGKPHRQIPLTSILDAIEYTSKKANQQSAPLSPSISAFGAASPFPFGRSPLLGGGGGDKGGGGASAAIASASANEANQGTAGGGSGEKRSASLPPISKSVVGSSDAEHGAMSGAEADTETAPERRVTIAAAVPPSHLTTPNKNDDRSAAMLPAQSTTTPKKKKENCFKIITPKRVYVVCAPTEEEELRWLSALQALLAHYHNEDGGGAQDVAQASAGPAGSAGAAVGSGTGEQPIGQSLGRQTSQSKIASKKPTQDEMPPPPQQQQQAA